jgi:hypothetical protein
MNWELDNLTPEQELAIRDYGYVGVFHRVLLPRLMAMEPTRIEPDAAPPLPETDAQPLNTYIPLAHRT